MCGAAGFKVKQKGTGITDGMVNDFLKACEDSSRTIQDGNERCTYMTKFAKEKYGGVWQAIMIPDGNAENRGGSIKWVEDKHLYLEHEGGKFQLWVWKTS